MSVVKLHLFKIAAIKATAEKPISTIWKMYLTMPRYSRQLCG